MDESRITSNPALRWGAPCVRDTGITVSQVVALHEIGEPVTGILDACHGLTPGDVDAAIEWYRRYGEDGLGPRPPQPGDGHPRIAVHAAIQGGLPIIIGTRITVDAILGLWEHGFTLEQILAEYPSLTADDVNDAIAYDAEASR